MKIVDRWHDEGEGRERISMDLQICAGGGQTNNDRSKIRAKSAPNSFVYAPIASR